MSSGSVQIDGQKLKEVRESRFMSRSELALKSDMNLDYIGRLERGDATGNVRLSNARRLADALGVQPQKLVVAE